MKGYKLLDTPEHHGPVTLPGFPGVWMPLESKSLEALGLEEEEAAQLVEDLALPLEAVSDAPEPPDWSVTAGMVSNATRASEATTEYVEEVATEMGPADPIALAEPAATSDYPKTHAALDDLADTNDFEWASNDLTVAEKQEALAGAGIKPEAEEE